MAPPPEQPILKHPPAQWDPFRNYEFDKAPLSSTAIFRVKKDLMLLFTEPPPGLFVTPDESDMMIIHAIIIGTVETPYEGGFFYFVIRCPPDYPIRPPLVKFMTTNAGTVRFNPNLYKNGKVCLSILGTWEGPAWSPAQQISSLLLSIQSLLTEKPYHNEPGFEQERYPGDVQRYNEIIKHETLRVAVCGMLENECCLHIPPSLRQIMEQTFLQYYDHYITVAKENLSMDGMKMLDPFRDERGCFRYRYTLKRLEALHATLSAKYGSVENLSPSEKCDSDTISSETKVNNTAEESEETNCEAASNCEADDSCEASGICETSVECKVDSNATEDCKSTDCKSIIETKTPTQSDTVQSSS